MYSRRAEWGRRQFNGRGGSTAFTLVELTGVLVILAVLATSASLMLHGSRRRAELADAVGQVAFADSAARAAARAADGPVSLVYTAHGGRAYRSTAAGRAVLADLPADVTLGRVCVGSDTADFGEVTVPVSAAGLTPTYAVRVDAGPAGHQWVVFAGASGQPTRVTDEQADAILDFVGRGDPP